METTEQIREVDFRLITPEVIETGGNIAAVTGYLLMFIGHKQWVLHITPTVTGNKRKLTAKLVPHYRLALQHSTLKAAESLAKTFTTNSTHEIAVVALYTSHVHDARYMRVFSVWNKGVNQPTSEVSKLVLMP